MFKSENKLKLCLVALVVLSGVVIRGEVGYSDIVIEESTSDSMSKVFVNEGEIVTFSIITEDDTDSIPNENSSIQKQNISYGWADTSAHLANGAHKTTFKFDFLLASIQYCFHYTVAYENNRYVVHRRHVKGVMDGNTTYVDCTGVACIVGGIDGPDSLPDRDTSKSVINGNDNIDFCAYCHVDPLSIVKVDLGSSKLPLHAKGKIWQKQHEPTTTAKISAVVITD